MRTLPLISVALGLASAQIGVKDFCDDSAWKSSTFGLAAFWGVDAYAIWESPGLFSATINQQLLPPYNITNFVKICNGLSMFYAGLTSRYFDICLGPIGWVGRGKSPAIAFAFDGMLSSLSFQCGAGFNSLVHSPNVASCLQRTTVQYDNEISQFYDSYEKNILHDQSNACTYAQTLVNGVTAIYGAVAGPCAGNTAHAQWFACEMTRNYVFSQFKHCRHQLTCPKSSKALDFSYMIREGPAGEVEFLLPAHWEKNGDGEWAMAEDKWI